MGGSAALIYGVVVYAFFLGTFLYTIAFVGDLPVPKTINSGETGPLLPTLTVNVLLLGLFAAQHSGMARQRFKRRWTAIVPPAVERSTYVLISTVILVFLMWQWRPLPHPLWSVANPTAVAAIQTVFWLGWFVVLLSTFLISHWELFGLKQIYVRLTGRSLPPPEFKTPLLYKHVRHPLYLGFLLAFWATPEMTYGHLLFAVATTAYILVGIRLEERDLVALFGDRYRRYREQVSMIIPLPGRTLASSDDRAMEMKHGQAGSQSDRSTASEATRR